ncbi:MAG TPA: FN3 associated domain-containing protein [Puia sp.]|nr:FN3 associated domain-containing protein [Puia sp.]
MNFLKNLAFSLTIAANCLLGFLLIFYDRFVVPSWLQVIGRMHPLFLHFPIVLLVLYVCWVLGAPKYKLSPPELTQEISKGLLLAAAFTSVTTALMGIFLSKEAGYNQESLQLHKWSGVSISWLTLLWYCFYSRLNKIKLVPITALASLVVIVFVGHEGASITHGDNFLLAPITPEQKQKKPSFAEAVVFTDMVKPILDAKCMSCHNSKKAKGELIMETKQSLLKGGRDGQLWDTTKADFGLLFQRIHLPLTQKKHMPPDGKEQLTDQEMVILYSWVKRGADFKLKVKDLSQTDTLKSIAENIFKTGDADEIYDFEAADEKTVGRLNTNYRAVYRLARESPALAVEFYGAFFFKTDQLKDLLPIKTQIVSLSLNKMPVTDADLQTVAQFINLRNLNLSFTNISGAGLSYLSTLTHLKNLSLSNTSVKGSDIDRLASLKELRHLYVWNTSVAETDAKSVKQNQPDLHIDFGMRTDTLLTKLNPPILKNEETIIDTPVSLKLKHYVPGITIRYTLDGSDPDSLHSPVYENNVKLSKQVLVKAKAFKSGWLASDLLAYQFYHATFKPDTIILLQPADSLYKGKGSKTLYNGEKGDFNLRSGKWLGFRKNPMECLLVFSKPVNASSVTIGSIVDRNGSVLPPKTIELWGGGDSKNLKLLTRMTPQQPTTSQPGSLVPFECKFKTTDVKYIRLIVHPFPTLPKEVQTKTNKKGWFFVDELFVN